MCSTLYISSFFFYCYGHHRHLHSFPTRRSSDLPHQHGHRDGVLAQDQHLRAVGVAEGVQRVHNAVLQGQLVDEGLDRKSTRLNSSHVEISYAVFCLKKKKKIATENHYELI